AAPAPVHVAPVHVALVHHEIEHRGRERVNEIPEPTDDHRAKHGGERDEATTPHAPPPLPSVPAPVEHHDEGGDGAPVPAASPAVAHEAAMSGDGGQEGPGPVTTTTTVAVPSSSGDGSSSDHHDEMERGSAAVVETDGGGDPSTTTSTTTPMTTTTTTT